MKLIRNVRSIVRRQQGFTILELLIAIAITGVIASSILMVIINVFDSNRRSINHMAAVKEVENAVYWMVRDGQMAQDVTVTSPPPDGNGFPVCITWQDLDDVIHNVTYDITGGQLVRTDTQAGTTILVKYINDDPALTCCEVSDPLIDFKITSTVGGTDPESETRSFQIMMRSPND